MAGVDHGLEGLAMSRPLRVAVVFEYASLNGGEHSWLSMLPQVQQAGIQPTACVGATGDLTAALEAQSVEWRRFAMTDGDQRLPLSGIRENLSKVLDELQPDVVHCNSLSTSRIGGPVCQSLGWRTLGHLRDMINVSQQAMRDIGCCDRLLAVSQATADWHIRSGLPAERVFVQYNGVNLQTFSPGPPKCDLRRELRLADDATLLLTIGQLGPRKGTDLVLASAQQLAKTFPQVHWVIVGERHSRKSESVEFEADLRRRAAGPDLRGRVHFLGRRTDVPDLMRSADLLIHAARQEPLGRVLIEAAASGLPIVATRVGGTGEILTHHDAFVVTPNSVEAITRSVVSLLSDPSRRGALSKAGRRQMEQRFDVVKRGRELADHYKILSGVS